MTMPNVALELAWNPSRDRMARYDIALARHQISMAQVARMIEVAPDSYHVHQMLGQLYAVSHGE